MIIYKDHKLFEIVETYYSEERKQLLGIGLNGKEYLLKHWCTKEESNLICELIIEQLERNKVVDLDSILRNIDNMKNYLNNESEEN